MSRAKYSEEFQEFWSRRWNGCAKHLAYLEWQKMDQEDRELAMSVVDAHGRRYCQEPMRFRPHMRTWLHQRRYEDELGDPMESQRVEIERQEALREMGWGGMVQ